MKVKSTPWFGLGWEFDKRAKKEQLRMIGIFKYNFLALKSKYVGDCRNVPQFDDFGKWSSESRILRSQFIPGQPEISAG